MLLSVLLVLLVLLVLVLLVVLLSWCCGGVVVLWCYCSFAPSC